MDAKPTVIGFFIYFWFFQIAAFIVYKLMNLVNGESSLKVVLILFVINTIAYTFLYFVKKNGDRKRAARKASAEQDVNYQNRKGKKRK